MSASWLHSLHRRCRGPVLLAVLLGTGGGLCTIVQAGLLAQLIHRAVMDGAGRGELQPSFLALVAIIVLRALFAWGREVCGQRASTLVRRHVREQLLVRIDSGGPMFVEARQTAPLLSSLLERVEGLHGYFAHYLPQRALAMIVPVMIIIVAFSVSWAVGLIFLVTAPLIPLFMVMIGRGAESLNQKNFQILSRMSAHFLDTLQGLATLKLFQRAKEEAGRIASSADTYRKGTMAVLRLAFLSSAILEFLSSVAIAMTAVFLGLSYLHFLDFGLYGGELTLHSGLFLLLLAPDLYLPLRELGSHFHARAEALGAAVELSGLLAEEQGDRPLSGTLQLGPTQAITLELRHVGHSFVGRDQPALNDLCLTVRPASGWRWSVPAAPGKPPCLSCFWGFCPCNKGRLSSTATPWGNLIFMGGGGALPGCRSSRSSFLAASPTISPWRTRRWRWRESPAPPAGPVSSSLPTTFPRVWPPRSASRAICSPGVRRGGWPWRGPLPGMPRCCCLTSRPPASIWKMSG
jgi:ATP-binding cassette, subfamily C, bacterial CydD